MKIIATLVALLALAWPTPAQAAPEDVFIQSLSTLKVQGGYRVSLHYSNTTPDSYLGEAVACQAAAGKPCSVVGGAAQELGAGESPGYWRVTLATKGKPTALTVLVGGVARQVVVQS